MQVAQHNLFTRPDTFFGVCEGIGEDLGVHANLLRIALAGFLFWNPPIAIAVYGALGMIVLVSRLLAPNPAIASIVPDTEGTERVETLADAEPLPLAA